MSNDRLEFLGDALVGLVTASHLYWAFPEDDEGRLTVMRSEIVKSRSLAEVAASLDLGRYLLLGKGEEAGGGRTRESNLAAAFEALAGAMLVDRGYEAAREFVLKSLGPGSRGPSRGPSGELQIAAAGGRPEHGRRTADLPDRGGVGRRARETVHRGGRRRGPRGRTGLRAPEEPRGAGGGQVRAQVHGPRAVDRSGAGGPSMLPMVALSRTREYAAHGRRRCKWHW